MAPAIHHAAMLRPRSEVAFSCPLSTEPGGHCGFFVTAMPDNRAADEPESAALITCRYLVIDRGTGGSEQFRCLLGDEKFRRDHWA